MKTTPNFIAVMIDGEPHLINPGQVRIVDQIAEDHIRLIFSEAHVCSVRGPAAGHLAGMLIGTAVTSRGESAGEIMLEALKTSRTRSPSEDEGRG